MIKVQTLPTPEDWGWKFENEKLITHWTDLPETAVAIRDLIKCACKPEKGCRGQCKCVQLSCFVQNFVLARDNMDGNRHNLICQ